MKKQLTLLIEERAITVAKVYAREHATSVSQLVEQFFEQLGSSDSSSELTAHVRSLLGRIEGADVDEET